MISLYRVSQDKSYLRPLTPKCIILDLDETLVHTADSCNKLGVDIYDLATRARMYIIPFQKNTTTPMVGVIRPHVTEFLDFCFQYFDQVCVWSAGTPEYVKRIVDIIFQEQKPNLVFARDKCIYVNDVICKPIADMIAVNNKITLENTYFIDDQPTAFVKNQWNGITIPAFDPRYEDQRLVELMEWFLDFTTLCARDVRVLNKTRIFT